LPLKSILFPYTTLFRSSGLWKFKVQVLIEQFITISLAHVLGLDHLGAQSGTVGDIYLQLFIHLLLVLAEEFVVIAQSGLLSGMPALGPLSDPFQFPFQGLLSFGCLFALLGQTFGFLVQPARIISLPGNSLPPVKFQDPTRYIVQEVSVVGHCD